MDTLATNVIGGTQNEAPANELYGDEVLFAGWIPLRSILGESAFPRLDGHVDLLANLMGRDFDAFLEKVYKHQR